MIAEKFNQEFAKDLRSQFLPLDYVSGFWRDNAVAMLQTVSPSTLGIGIKDFDLLYQKLLLAKNQLSLFEFAVCNNLLENQSKKSLDISMSEYIRLQHEVIRLAEDWTARTQVIRVSVQKRINEEEKIRASLAQASIQPISAQA